MQEKYEPNLNTLERIRLRPGMYIGSTDLKGYLVLVQLLFEELLRLGPDYPIFEIHFYPGGKMAIQVAQIDAQKCLKHLEEVQSPEHKRDLMCWHILLALSSDVVVEVNDRAGKVVLRGQKGGFETAKTTIPAPESCFSVNFIADKRIFEGFTLVYEQVNDFFRQFAYLNPTLKIISTDNTTDELQRNVYHYPKGIFSQLDYVLSSKWPPSLRIDIESATGPFQYKIGMAYPYPSSIKTYAGNKETYCGGSLKDGILEGFMLSVKKIAAKEKVDLLINKKRLAKRLTMIAAMSGEGINLIGSTNSEIDMPKVQKAVKALVCREIDHYLGAHPEIVEAILRDFKRK